MKTDTESINITKVSGVKVPFNKGKLKKIYKWECAIPSLKELINL